MYALGLASVVAGDGITCPGQANFEHDTAATAQKIPKAIKLRGTGTVCDWLNYSRPGRAPQSHVDLDR